MRRTKAFKEPPDGVISGESVPVGSEEDNIYNSDIEKIMNKLKQRGEPYISMSEEDRREKALEIWHKRGK